MSVTASVEQVTPEMANEWLATNVRNRNINQLAVRRYADEMLRGAWLLTGQGIQFDRHGHLIDGQHRLRAVIAAKVTVPMLVVRNVDGHAQDVIDCGRKRSPGDTLAMAGVTNSANVAAGLKLLHNYLEDKWPGGWGAYVPNAEVARLAQEHPDMSDSVRVGMRSKVLMQPSIGSFCHYMFASGNLRHKANEFFAALDSGESLEYGNPILLLRNRLIANATAKAKLPPPETTALIIKAWNAWVSGKSLGVLKWVSAEDFPRPITHREPADA